MNFRQLICRALFAAMVIPTAVLADTVICTDGRRVSGEVIPTPDGYLVKTKFGVNIEVKTGEVREVVKDKPVAPVKPATGTGAGNAPAAADPGPVNTQGLNAVTPKPAATGHRTPGGTKSLEALIKLGSDSILAGDYPAARDAFSDAVSIDNRNVKAIHGLGLASLYLNEPQRANLLLQRAYEVSGGKPDRALVLNIAMTQIAMNQPVRAVKFTSDYITAHKDTPDEAMLVALGSGLFLSDYVSRRNPLWLKSGDLFVEYQKVIEKTRPGMKLWGVEWLPAKETDAKLTAMRTMMKEAGKVGTKVDEQEMKLFEAKQTVRRMQVGVEKGFNRPAELVKAQGKVNQEQAEFERMYKEYDAACDAVVRPLFPRVLTPVAIDDLTPGVNGSIAASMSDPAYLEALAKAKTAKDPGKRSAVAKEPEPDRSKPVTPPPAVVDEPPPPVIAIKPEAGRKVRVHQYAAAFAVAEDLVVTSAAAVEEAVEIELQGTDGAGMRAQVVRKDAKSGLALLRLVSPDKKLAYFAVADKFAGGQLVCAAFPTVDLFNPSLELLGGLAEAPKDGWTVKLTRHPRLPGSPLIAGTRVVGVVLANRDAAVEQLPAAGPDAVAALVGADAGKGLGTKDASLALMQLTAIREVGGK